MARPSASNPPPPAPHSGKLSAHHREGVTESVEDYLECISVLLKRNGRVSVSDVAESLNLVRPSVSLMIKRLDDLGYLKRQPYRGFVLTEKGREVAESIETRHEVLTELFTLIGLDPETHENDIEGLEHHISDPVLSGLEALIGHLRRHPMPEA